MLGEGEEFGWPFLGQSDGELGKAVRLFVLRFALRYLDPISSPSFRFLLLRDASCALYPASFLLLFAVRFADFGTRHHNAWDKGWLDCLRDLVCRELGENSVVSSVIAVASLTCTNDEYD